MKCGKDASLGRRIDTTQHFAPRWVWLGLIGLFPLVPLYFAGRKTLRLSYSLCRKCDHVERRKRWIAIGAWLLAAVTALVSVRLDDAWILIATGILLVVAVVAYLLANTPILVSGYADEVFTVKGVSEEFLAVRRTPAD